MKHTLPLLAILLAITFLSACKKDSSVDVFELEITLPKTQLKALELALIEVNASVNETESFTGSIESESVEFHPNGRFLIFKVPSGNPGLKSGSVSVNGEEFMFEYQLMANSFSDAELF